MFLEQCSYFFFLFWWLHYSCFLRHLLAQPCGCCCFLHPLAELCSAFAPCAPAGQFCLPALRTASAVSGLHQCWVRASQPRPQDGSKVPQLPLVATFPSPFLEPGLPKCTCSTDLLLPSLLMARNMGHPELWLELENTFSCLNDEAEGTRHQLEASSFFKNSWSLSSSASYEICSLHAILEAAGPAGLLQFFNAAAMLSRDNCLGSK